MKNLKTNNQNKIKSEEYKPNFSFSWVFSANGVDSQLHCENDYRAFLDMNYVGRSNQDFL